MRTCIAILAVFAAITAPAAAQQIDREKLRRVARFPDLSVNVGFGLSLRRGLILSLAEKPDTRAEIAALQKAMKRDASDAERYYRLGLLYSQAAEERKSALTTKAQTTQGIRLEVRALDAPERLDHARSEQAIARSVQLYRQRVKSRPRNGRLLAQFGEALSASSKQAEAERVLRQAVEVAPREWRAWVALGIFLSGRRDKVLLGDVETRDTTDLEVLVQRFAQLLQKKPSPEQIEKSQKLADEARHCFDRAVAVAPREPQVYVRRATFGSLEGILQSVVHALGGEPRNSPTTFFGAMLSPDRLADWRQVARLSPHDFDTIGAVALVDVVSLLIQREPQSNPFEDPDVWETLPEKTQRSVREAVAKLARLAQSKETHPAAGASTVQGLLQTMIMRDDPGAEASFRRAISLEPSREQAWDLLTQLLNNDEDRYDDEIALCKERLKRNDSARGRMLLARAYQEGNQLGDAEEQVQAALRLAPDDFTANLALAVLLIKRSEDAGVLSRVRELLTKAGAALGASPDPKDWADHAVTWGICLALSGDPGSARQQLNHVLECDKGNEQAKVALAALGN
jgi:tetratricopeptide (TPR) repeat protein